MKEEQDNTEKLHEKMWKDFIKTHTTNVEGYESSRYRKFKESSPLYQYHQERFLITDLHLIMFKAGIYAAVKELESKLQVEVETP